MFDTRDPRGRSPKPEPADVFSFERLPEGTSFKVLFVYPNVQRVRTPQLGVAVLSACLKRIGAETRLFDSTLLPRGRELEWFEPAVRDYQPDLLAYSVRSNEWSLARRLLEFGRTIGIPQIVGGPHPTHAPEETIPFVDAQVVGEGEGALLDVVRHLAAGRSPAGVANTWVRTPAGIVKTPKRRLIQNLDALPLPDWRLFADAHYRNSFAAKLKDGVRMVAAIEGSRGCPFRCAYCSNEALMLLYENLGRWRREKSPQRMVEELEAFRAEFGELDFVYWVDEIWLTGVPRLREFRDAFQTRIGAPFSIMERPECVTEEKIEIMADAGLHQIAIGLETGDERTRLEVLNRRTNRDTLRHAFLWPKQHGISVHAFAMLGLPGEDEGSILKTWRFLRDVMPDTAQFTIFHPLKGTRLYDRTVEMGLYDPRTTAENYYTSTVLRHDRIDSRRLSTYQTLLSKYATRPGVWPVIAFHLNRRSREVYWLLHVFRPRVGRTLRHQAGRLANLYRSSPPVALRKILRNLREWLGPAPLPTPPEPGGPSAIREGPNVEPSPPVRV